jgi:hypothetical protein
MSLPSWRNYGKMSLEKRVSVSDLVRKYRIRYPTAPRDLLRKTIRLELEHQKVSFTEAIRKKLDRELRKSFSKPLDHVTEPSDRVVDPESEQKIIRKVIENHFPNGINVHFLSKYATSVDPFEQALKEAAIRTGNNPENQLFKERFYKSLKENSLDSS